jgi:hypothetical protein
MLIVIAAAAASTAKAQTDDSKWSLKISEKEAAITQPENTDLQNFLMWDLGSDRVMSRNMPVLELKNEGSEQPITEFRMTIGDERFHFDCEILGTCARIASAPGGVTSMVIPGLGDVGALQGGELVLTFGDGGLEIGELARFQIALGVDVGHDFFHRPDFRTVLFDMNEINVYDGNLHLPNGVDPSDDNSIITLKFGSGANLVLGSPVPFEDFGVTGNSALYYNDIFRRYGVMESVDTFLILGGPGGAIPEPSSLVLALVFVASSLSFTRSRFRVTRGH